MTMMVMRSKEKAVWSENDSKQAAVSGKKDPVCPFRPPTKGRGLGLPR